MEKLDVFLYMLLGSGWIAFVVALFVRKHVSTGLAYYKSRTVYWMRSHMDLKRKYFKLELINIELRKSRDSYKECSDRLAKQNKELLEKLSVLSAPQRHFVKG